MTQRQSFVRKVKYLVVIAVLLLPLSWLSRPAAVDSQGARTQRGGLLAQQREQHRLSQANLGEVDPAGEAIKLATLGLRGVAANILWSKANHYKMVQDWTNFAATLQQISKLQPNYVAVWRYQAWNMSYNVSVEWDDYHDRYYWVMRGIDYLQDGIRYNEDDTRLIYDKGWFIAHKIGMADERVQFRRLFREDDDFHGTRPLAERDNWLVGKEWFRRAEELVATRHVPIRGVSPLIFYAKAPLAQISYATALEEDGTFGDRARLAWEQGGAEWRQFGDVDLPTGQGESFRLNDLDRLQALAGRTVEEIEALQPGLREQIYHEKLAALDEAELAVLALAADQRNFEQEELALQAARKVDVTLDEVAERVDEPNQAKAKELVERVNAQAPLMGTIRSNRHIVNYDYWARRTEMEQSPDALAAREKLYRAGELFHSDWEAARANYEEAFVHWRAMLDQFPDLRDDGIIGEDMFRQIARYEALLKQLDEPFPEDFILQDVWEQHLPGSFHVQENLPPRPDGGADSVPRESPSPPASPPQPAP